MGKYIYDESGRVVKVEYKNTIFNEDTLMNWSEELHMNKVTLAKRGIKIIFFPIAKNRDIFIDKLIFKEPSILENDSNRTLLIEKIFIEYINDYIEINTSEFTNITNISCDEHSIKITGQTWGFDDYTIFDHKLTKYF